jgi:beta-aspartyl-peptidase (threonine type)
MEEGGSALDAVEAATRVLEDDPVFDAGKGSALTSAGGIEMDALIVDGSNSNFGSVACLTKTRSAVSATRKVMENSSHCMFVGRGADDFAVVNCPSDVIENEEDMVTEGARAHYERYKEYDTPVSEIFNNPQQHHDTIGCVAVSKDGNVAAATSTGGIPQATPGRCGDR